jgi:hypothetical protein
MGKKKDRKQGERGHCTTNVMSSTCTDWQRIENIHRFADTLWGKYGGRVGKDFNAHTFDGINYVPVAAVRFLAEQAADLAHDLDHVLSLAGSIYTVALEGVILPPDVILPSKGGMVAPGE